MKIMGDPAGLNDMMIPWNHPDRVFLTSILRAQNTGIMCIFGVHKWLLHPRSHHRRSKPSRECVGCERWEIFSAGKWRFWKGPDERS